MGDMSRAAGHLFCYMNSALRMKCYPLPLPLPALYLLPMPRSGVGCHSPV